MLELDKQELFSTWIEVGEEKRIFCELPTIEQKDKLSKILNRSLTYGIVNKEMNQDLPITDMYEYNALYLRYCIKDWEGFPFKLELVNGEIEESQWKQICYDKQANRKDEQNSNLVALIKSKIEPTEEDKKK